MKVNDYVRTKYEIGKIVKCNSIYFILDIDKDNIAHEQNEIIKSSPNIIDLIEVGDYVDKLRVVDKYEDYIVVETFDERIVIQKEDNIKSIVTIEQFESMEYRL